MDLSDYSAAHGELYVPTCQVLLAGDDMVSKRLIAFSQAEVDLELKATGRFSFTIVNAYDVTRSEFLSGTGDNVLEQIAFGTPVEILLGYGSDLTSLITGTITEIGTSFPETGYPELVVSGYDKAFPLTVGKNSSTYVDKADSDAALAVAQRHNLDTDIQDTGTQHPRIEQNQESDLEFIRKLAERNHYEFYMRDSTLRFAPPKDKSTSFLSLAWGAGLLSFKPEANLARQVSRVEVYGWDVQNKQTFKGVASAGDESGRDSGGTSAADVLQRAAFGKPVMTLRQPVFSQQEADARARATLNEIAKQFLTGEGECLGVPELLPDESVALSGLGSRFSKTYYVYQTTHRFDAGGYRTRFKVRESTL